MQIETLGTKNRPIIYNIEKENSAIPIASLMLSTTFINVLKSLESIGIERRAFDARKIIVLGDKRKPTRSKTEIFGTIIQYDEAFSLYMCRAILLHNFTGMTQDSIICSSGSLLEKSLQEFRFNNVIFKSQLVESLKK